MTRLSWPAIWIIAIVVLVAGYFVGQALHLDHQTTAAPAATVSTVSTQI